MADSTLTAVRTKVRRLTRSPSTTQLTDAEIDEYINTFIQYDFPEHLRLKALRETYTFYTEPYVDEYNSDNTSLQLNNFENRYISVHGPAYIDGVQVPLCQSREQFYGVYPRNNTRVVLGQGTGGASVFTGTIQSPSVRNNILFSSIDANNNGLQLHDFPGGVTGQVATLAGDGFGFVNYVTGEYDLNFTSPPAAGADITIHHILYTPSMPRSILFFDNAFFVRPIPDQAYRIDLEAYRRPTELLAGHSPELEQWWQYIAYGASIKLFQDRTDEEGVRMLMPEFKQQERLVLRKTIVQQSNERVATIYSDNTSGYNNGWWNR